MDKIKRTERGWGAHHICAARCLFRRNTLLEYKNKKLVISTIGAFFPKGEDGEIEIVGCDRYYETMVFKSDPKDIVYHDADVRDVISFKSKGSINKKEFYDNKNRIDNIANNMHDKVVREMTLRLKNNKLERSSL